MYNIVVFWLQYHIIYIWIINQIFQKIMSYSRRIQWIFSLEKQNELLYLSSEYFDSKIFWIFIGNEIFHDSWIKVFFWKMSSLLDFTEAK